MGFVNTLEDVLKKEQPTHIGIAFDPAGPTFRHEAYQQYKAQREETPEVIRLSVPIIKDIIRAYRIPILEVSGYEADDVIGTLATEAGRQGITTYMMTPDKDYGQLVSDNVFMYRPKYGDKEFEVMGVEEVKAKFDIQSPAQVIDMLGLMGRYRRQHPRLSGRRGKNRTKADCPVRKHREPARPYRRTERSHQDESGNQPRTNPVLQISCHHQDRRTHRSRHGRAET